MANVLPQPCCYFRVAARLRWSSASESFDVRCAPYWCSLVIRSLSSSPDSCTGADRSRFSFHNSQIGNPRRQPKVSTSLPRIMKSRSLITLESLCFGPQSSKVSRHGRLRTCSWRASVSRQFRALMHRPTLRAFDRSMLAAYWWLSGMLRHLPIPADSAGCGQEPTKPLIATLAQFCLDGIAQESWSLGASSVETMCLDFVQSPLASAGGTALVAFCICCFRSCLANSGRSLLAS